MLLLSSQFRSVSLLFSFYINPPDFTPKNITGFFPKKPTCCLQEPKEEPICVYTHGKNRVDKTMGGFFLKGD